MANPITERANLHNKEHTRQFIFRFRLDEDREIIERLESVPSKIGYVRELILRDIECGEERVLEDYYKSLERKGFYNTTSQDAEKKG